MTPNPGRAGKPRATTPSAPTGMWSATRGGHSSAGASGRKGPGLREMPGPSLLRTVGTPHVDMAITAFARDANKPGIAAHLAVLNETSRHVGLDEDLAVLATVRTRHNKSVVHARPFLPPQPGSSLSQARRASTRRLPRAPSVFLLHPVNGLQGDPEPRLVVVRGEFGAEPEGLPVGFPVGVERRQGSRATGPVLARSFDDDGRSVGHGFVPSLPSESFTIMIRPARLPGLPRLPGVAPPGRGCRGIQRPGGCCRPKPGAGIEGMTWRPARR